MPIQICLKYKATYRYLYLFWTWIPYYIYNDIGKDTLLTEESDSAISPSFMFLQKLYIASATSYFILFPTSVTISNGNLTIV